MANPIDINKEFGELKKFNEELAKTAELTGQLLTNSKKLTTELGKTKGLSDQNKKRTEVQKQQNEVETQGNKLLKQRNTLVAKQDKSLRQLTKETIKEREAVQQLNKEIKAEGDAYKKLNLQYEKAAKNAKKLAAQYGTNSKKAKEAAKEATGLSDKLKEIDSSVGQSQRSVGDYGKVWDNVKGNLLKFTSVAAIVAGALKLIWSEISRTQGFQFKWEQGLNASRAALDVLHGSIKQSIAGNGGFKDFNKRLDESIKRSIELTRQLQTLSIAQAVLTKKTNELSLVEGLYQSIADDATLSFQRRAEFAEKAFNAREKRVNAEVELTKEAFEIEKNIQDEQVKNGVSRTVEQLNQIVILRNAYDNSRAELKRIDLDYSKFKRELDLDDFEQELDFIFDVADKRKTANEKIIADESKTQKERQSLLDETDKLLNESFEDQIRLFETFHNLQIDTNKLLTLNNKESFEYARSLGLSERATNRLLEVIRERIAATSDLNEEQKGIFKSEAKRLTFVKDEVMDFHDIEEENHKDIMRWIKEEEDAQKIKADLIKSIKQQEWDIVNQTGNAIFDLAQSQRDGELSAIQADYAAKIAAAEGNNTLQTRLSDELAAEQLRIRQEQAKSERNQALFNLAITTAQKAFEIKAQAAVLASNPATIALAPLALAQLGLLLSSSLISGALIASTEIPGFFKGTENAPAGLAHIAEKGAELLTMPSGESLLVNEPSLMNLEAGTKVKTAEQTTDILNKAIYNDIAVNGNEGIENRLDKLNRSINNQAKEVTIFDDDGIKRHLSKGNSITNYQNRRGRR